MATVAFWAAAVLLAQTYFLYPLWLVLLARVRPGRRGTAADPDVWPAVSLVVAAHDEAACIGGDEIRIARHTFSGESVLYWLYSIVNPGRTREPKATCP